VQNKSEVDNHFSVAANMNNLVLLQNHDFTFSLRLRNQTNVRPLSVCYIITLRDQNNHNAIEVVVISLFHFTAFIRTSKF